LSFTAGPITFTFDGHGYFYSGDVEAHAEDKVDWLEARNTCREYCMDLVSLETPSEDELINKLITTGKKNMLPKPRGRNDHFYFDLRSYPRSLHKN
jgi:hypothetical protein